MRVPCSAERCTIAHSCRPKQPNCGVRPAVAVSSVCSWRSSGRCESTYAAETVECAARVDQCRSALDLLVALQPGVLRGVLQRDPEPRVPAAQLGGAVGVVGEEEVVDRVRDLLRPPGEVRLDERVDAGRVGVGPRDATRTGEHLHRSEASARAAAGGH